MKEFLSPEIAALIAKLILEYGTPGAIIILLLEERRRLTNKVESLQKRLDDSYEARVKTGLDALSTIKDHESAIDRMTDLLKTVLSMGQNRRIGKHD